MSNNSVILDIAPLDGYLTPDSLTRDFILHVGDASQRMIASHAGQTSFLVSSNAMLVNSSLTVGSLSNPDGANVLDVYGPIKIRGDIDFTGTLTQNGVATATTSPWTTAGDGSAIYITQSNVGIGTSASLTEALTVQGNVVPSACNAYDLGTDALRWRDLWLSGNTLHIGETTLQTTAQGDLTVNRSVFPTSDNAFFMGDSNLRFKQMFCAQSIVLGSNIIESAGDQLTFQVRQPDNSRTPAKIVVSTLELSDGSSNVTRLKLSSEGKLQYQSGTITDGDADTFVAASNVSTSGIDNLFAFNSNIGIGLSNPAFRLQVAGDIVPSACNQYDLGTTTLQFRSVYASSNVQTNRVHVGVYLTKTEYAIASSGTAQTIDWNNAQLQALTLDNNCTVTIGTAPGVGHYQLRLIQDATGNRTVTWSGISSSRWLGASNAPDLNTAANGESLAVFYWDGANYLQSLTKVGTT